MKLNKYGLILTLLLFIVSVSSVTAADNTTDSVISDINHGNLDNNYCLSVNDSHIDDNILHDDKYCCGAIAFQSVLKENGVNITLEESNKAIHSINGSTSMQGLIDGAKVYNLTVYPVKINSSDLQPNFIVHMNINGANHWCVMEDIIDNSDVSDNNIILDLAKFNKYYDNNALLITKDTNLNINTLHATLLSSLECEKITGNGKLKPVIMVAKKVYKWAKKNGKIISTKLREIPPIPPIDELNINITYK